MTTPIVRCFASLLALVVTGACSVLAAKAEESAAAASQSVEARFAGLEAELDALKSQVERSDSGGGSCNAECCCGECCLPCCCPSGGWIAGGGCYFVKPHWENNPAFVIGNAAGIRPVATQTDFDYDYQAAPLVWLGYVDPTGLGARARYWTFDHDDVINTPALPPPFLYQTAAPLGLGGTGNVTSIFQSSLELHSLDLEAVKQVNDCWWNATFSAGVRYARLEQAYRGIVAANNLVFVQTTHDFKGVGPTASVEFRHAVGGSALSVYALGRGAVLFGDSSQFATSSFATNETPVRFADHSAVLPVLEFEFGATWFASQPYGGLFVNAALVGQSWFGAGNSSNNELLVFTVPNAAARGAQETADNGSILGFFGLTVSAGVTH